MPATMVSTSTAISASTSSSDSGRKVSADEDFDDTIRDMWNAHMATLGPDLAKSKTWGGRYWKIWYAAVPLDGNSGFTGTGKTNDCNPVLDSPPKAVICWKYPKEMLESARRNFAKFQQIPIADVDAMMIDRLGSSLGVEGWADPRLVVLDYDQIERDRISRETRTAHSCWSFGTYEETSSSVDDGDVEGHNDQVAKVIACLGETNSGRRAVIKAVAERQGIVDPDELEQMYAGNSSSKLRVPQALRGTLQEIGLGDLLSPVNLVTVKETTEVLVNEEAWRDIEFEVALDSGSVVHVCSIDDCPGYRVAESPGSRRGQDFLMGDGGTIPNLGQSQLNLSDGDKDIESVFQIAAVTRPLMSVGRICDEGHSITFNAVMAVVHGKDGAELCRFQRNGSGLYVAKLKLRSPAGFGGQE